MPIQKGSRAGKLADPEWRRQRAMKAGQAAAKVYLKRAMKLGPDYIKGYRDGYRRAYRAWKARYDRLLRRVGAA